MLLALLTVWWQGKYFDYHWLIVVPFLAPLAGYAFDEAINLTRSLARWDAYLSRKGGLAKHAQCGTLWVAEDEVQMAHAVVRAERLAQRGWSAVLLSGAELARAEPSLRRGLAGGIRVEAEDDSRREPP